MDALSIFVFHFHFCFHFDKTALPSVCKVVVVMGEVVMVIQTPVCASHQCLTITITTQQWNWRRQQVIPANERCPLGKWGAIN